MKRADALAAADSTMTELAVNDIRSRIFTIRGVQVILDRDLAALYGVLTKNLNKAVSRNAERFPEDFMFRLTKEESLRFQIGTSKKPLEASSGDDTDVLRFQTGTLKLGQGKHFKYQPYAFTENGIAMLSSDVASFNAQYGGLTVRTSVRFHDRFAIIDDKSLYLFGASLKDLGKKCFAFTKLDAAEIPRLKARI